MYKFERKPKFLVLKLKDCDEFLSPEQQSDLSQICKVIRQGRLEIGKKDNSYVVVNCDEPYAEEVWKLIEQEERLKNTLVETENNPRGSFFNP